MFLTSGGAIDVVMYRVDAATDAGVSYRAVKKFQWYITNSKLLQIIVRNKAVTLGLLSDRLCITRFCGRAERCQE